MYRNSVVAHLLHFQFGEHPLVGLGLAWNSKLMRHASATHHSSFHSASGMSGMPKRPSVGSFLQPMLKKGTGGFVSESSYLRPYCSISLKGSPPPPPTPLLQKLACFHGPARATGRRHASSCHYIPHNQVRCNRFSPQNPSLGCRSFNFSLRHGSTLSRKSVVM